MDSLKLTFSAVYTHRAQSDLQYSKEVSEGAENANHCAAPPIATIWQESDVLC